MTPMDNQRRLAAGFTEMNYQFRLARTLAEASKWSESADAYELARQKAEAIGATESIRYAIALRDIARYNAKSS